MKIGTMLAVVAAAAAVVAITVVAPARAAEPTHATVKAAAVCAADCDRDSLPVPPSHRRWPDAPEPGAWLLVLSGLVGLGAMLRASRAAFER